MAVERQGQCLNLNISLAGRQSEVRLSIFCRIAVGTVV